MRRELHYYDIYPKTVKVGIKSEVTVKPLGSHVNFKQDRDYMITIIPMLEHNDWHKDEQYDTVTVKSMDGVLKFGYIYKAEQEYVLRIMVNDEQFIALSVYALEQDLYERLPLKGDLHVHSTYSDGAEGPELVAANYRKFGYDFMALTDHRNYQGSVAAISAYKDAEIDMCITHGEEIHSPKNDVHIVNFGGEYSVNDLYRDDEKGYYDAVERIQLETEYPKDFSECNKFEFAACCWVTENVRKAKGLSIFAHPNWIVGPYQIRGNMVEFMFKQQPFDAYELVGGQSPRENAMQVSYYNTAKAAGFASFPIVGNSDSHGTVREMFEGSSFASAVCNSYGFNEMKTIVFSQTNDKDAIVASIKAGYSVAIDEYHNETPRVHGDYRLTAYALFLLGEYFPIHDELCFEEGRAMRDYAIGEPNAKEHLSHLKGRVPKLMNKYFK